MSTPSSRRSWPRVAAPRLLLVTILAAGLGGCSGGASPTPSAGGSEITVTNASFRAPTAPGAPAAVYMTISNAGAQADALLGASSPDAASVELHETSMDSSGMMGMHPIERLDIPASGSVTLEPGGYHFMLIDLTTEALIAGATIELRLDFERAGAVVVEIVTPQG
ncbi:MAG: copper chaperone PCu(A)C [Chloroflexota bacterium]